MIFDGRLSPPGHDDDVGDAGSGRFFNRVLDQGLVDKRQHLFRLRFRRREKSRPQPGGGQNSFTDTHEVD